MSPIRSRDADPGFAVQGGPRLAPETILCSDFIESSLESQRPMARKCSSPGCAFSLPDKYPLAKCPWHLAPGRGPIKIAAAITIAAAGFGGGMAYKKFRAYLRQRELDKQRDARRRKPASRPKEEQAISAVGKPRAPRSQKQPRTRKRSATKPKRKTREGISEIQGSEPDSRLAARAPAKE
jgi:hypothetical protein